MSFIRYGEDYKNLVAGVSTMVPLKNGRYGKAINFGNAATTPPFYSVLQALADFAPWYGAIERGTGYKSNFTSEFYEKSRKEVMEFLSADTENAVLIYVKNTTEAINKLANVLDNKERDVVICTEMEHHSNDLPWRDKFKVCYAAVDDDGILQIDDIEKKLKEYGERVRLVTVAGAFNVTGYINDIYKIAALAHKYGTEILVDGAQLVPHIPVKLKNFKDEEHIDYIAFSAHKMYAPFGTGVLIGPRSTFEKCLPDCKGGGTIEKVTYDSVKWAPPPQKNEGGTQNVMGVVALISAIRTLKGIGMKNIESYEAFLTDYAFKKIKNIEGIEVYGTTEPCCKRLGIITFNAEGIDDEITADILAQEAGIAVRNGWFCAQPYARKLLKVDEMSNKGMVRVSFGLYNTYDEIDVLIDLLNMICTNKKYYLKEYSKTFRKK